MAIQLAETAPEIVPTPQHSRPPRRSRQFRPPDASSVRAVPVFKSFTRTPVTPALSSPITSSTTAFQTGEILGLLSVLSAMVAEARR